MLEIEKTLLVPDLRAGWADSINHGTRLLDKLAGLPSVPALGDYRPTDVSSEVFADLSARIDAEIAKFDALVKDELPKINELITSAGFHLTLGLAWTTQQAGGADGTVRAAGSL